MAKKKGKAYDVKVKREGPNGSPGYAIWNNKTEDWCPLYGPSSNREDVVERCRKLNQQANPNGLR